MFFLKFFKNLENKSPIEPILLFMVFFLPGFLFQNKQISGEIFNSPMFNLYYLVSVIPQILLLLYLISLKGGDSFKKFGIEEIILKDAGYGVLYALGVIGILFLAMIVMNLTAGIIPGGTKGNVLPVVDWQITNPAILPLVFLTTMTIGYSEELFFRSYLLTEFIKEDEDNRLQVVTAVSMLFAAGHIYQGTGGFISSFIIGIYFSLIFLKKRRIHSISVGHGLYNFSVLILSLFMSK